MGVVSMKVHHNKSTAAATTTAGLFWEHHHHHHHHHPDLSLGFNNKRLRPLAPKLESSPNSSSTNTDTNNPPLPPPSFDLKSFIRNDKHSPPPPPPRPAAALDHTTVHPGGTRWNPTQEQIGILEMLYRGGMRTPNAQQIEQITCQLGRYGKIEGKNVFYWFQNHKARERQKLKRNSSRTPFTLDIIPVGDQLEETIRSPSKRKCRSWGIQHQLHYKQQEQQEEVSEGRSSSSNSSRGGQDHDQDEEQGIRDGTLELFPLHPDGTLSLSPLTKLIL